VSWPRRAATISCVPQARHRSSDSTVSTLVRSVRAACYLFTPPVSYVTKCERNKRIANSCAECALHLDSCGWAMGVLKWLCSELPCVNVPSQMCNSAAPCNFLSKSVHAVALTPETIPGSWSDEDRFERFPRTAHFGVPPEHAHACCFRVSLYLWPTPPHSVAAFIAIPTPRQT